MSSRPVWIIFTILIIGLIEWLLVAKIVDGVLSKEVVSATLTIEDALRYLPDRTSVDLNGLREEKYSEIILTQDYIQRFGFSSKWQIIYQRQPLTAIFYVVGLAIAGVLAGILFASVAFRHIVGFGNRMGQLSTADKIAIVMGFLAALPVTVMFRVLFVSSKDPVISIILWVAVTYISVVAMMSMKDQLKFYFPGLAKGGEADKAFQKPKILDTNIIIDGRVADICRTGFIEGQVHVPSFVLEELQHIADSSDSLRRARGRRGLDILNQMRKELSLVITPSNAIDASNAEEVDARLVKLAKELDGAIVTNDFNLNKVAELQGVPVLNVNELANALKPVVLPGEEMTTSVIKEGKESNQGIAYLDDGTMIVIEGARNHIGETVDVIVTSVLQTVAGKMIFANLKAVQQEEDELIDRNVRNYSGFRPRKKTK